MIACVLVARLPDLSVAVLTCNFSDAGDDIGS